MNETHRKGAALKKDAPGKLEVLSMSGPQQALILRNETALSIEAFSTVGLSSDEVKFIIQSDLALLKRELPNLRLNAVTKAGNTLLHIAAEKGRLGACEFLLQAGADPEVKNHAGKTPGDLARCRGHLATAKALSLLSSSKSALLVSEYSITDSEKSKPKSNLCLVDSSDDLLELGLLDVDIHEQSFSFTVEESAEEFHRNNSSSKVFDESICRVEKPKEVDDIYNSGVDLSSIINEYAISHPVCDADADTDDNFMAVRGSGRKSSRVAKEIRGTNLSLELKKCRNWSSYVIQKESFSGTDVEGLVSECKGNGDREELILNIKRNLECSGFECFCDSEYVVDYKVFDSYLSDADLHDLTDSIDALLNRSYVLPGMHKFTMDKVKDQKALEPMIHAKYELYLVILSSQLAIEKVFDSISDVLTNGQKPGGVTLKNVAPLTIKNHEIIELSESYRSLVDWFRSGQILEGKGRRKGIEAIEGLDLSFSYLKELVEYVSVHESRDSSDKCMHQLISLYKDSANNLIIKHLPFVRRFAARNVNDGENVEDVFQVAFMGLLRSIRRFAPERGSRFSTYCTFWMRQSVSRWRADEGSLIRIPAHLHGSLYKLDDAMSSYSSELNSEISLAYRLQWPIEMVQQHLRIPRVAIYPEGPDEWDEIIPGYYQSANEDNVIEDMIEKELSGLRDREAEIIRLRFGIGCDREMTLEEIGRLYGLTRERIRQIEAKALKRLSLKSRISVLQEKLGI